LMPRAAVASEDVGGSAKRGAVVCRVAVDACGVAALVRRAHGEDVSLDGEGSSKRVYGPAVRGLEVGLLRPRPPVAGEHVHRAALLGAVVRLVAVDVVGVAGFTCGAHRDGVAVDGDSKAKKVLHARVGRLQVGLLYPDVASPRKHIDGSAACGF